MELLTGRLCNKGKPYNILPKMEGRYKMKVKAMQGVPTPIDSKSLALALSST
jgi:hypothetical protein